MKYVVMTGGVVSSLGKGIAISSIATLLEEHGYKVSNLKLDPYLNIDSSLLNPKEHGEVFVCDDGYESDLDLGHYERFTLQNISKKNNFTSGQIYASVLDKERKGEYLGQTIQIIPHITNEIKHKINECNPDSDVLLIELGGCIGDIESAPYLEALRQLRIDYGKENVVYIHLALAPYLESSKEIKTKPIQHSVRDLRSIGIQPDIIMVRSSHSIDDSIKGKISLFCDVKKENIFEAIDVDSIYKIPLKFAEQYIDMAILEHLNLKPIRKSQEYLLGWKNISKSLQFIKEFSTKKDNTCNIGIIGKYSELIDSYLSICEALNHAAISLTRPINIEIIDSEELEKINNNQIKNMLNKFNGILIPGGFGDKGIEGKIKAIQYARENKVPFFGICLGMQLATIEFARNVCGIKDATSAEFDNNSENKVIDYMENQRNVKTMGGTMRLGAYDCFIASDSKLFSIYKKEKISERHRHRFEFNNKYKEILESKGMKIIGINKENNLVEAVEISNSDNDFFIGVQYHPEFKSKPFSPHPLFVAFLNAIPIKKENVQLLKRHENIFHQVQRRAKK